MVQIHKNKSGELSELLGMSLGSGLAGLTNDYYADKAIKGVMEDASLKNSTPEEKYSKLALALRPFGARGQQTLENLVSIEDRGIKRKEAETEKIRLRKKEALDEETTKRARSKEERDIAEQNRKIKNEETETANTEEEVYNLYKEAGYSDNEAFKRRKDSVATARDVFKQKTKPEKEPKETPFEAAVGRKNAEEYIKNEDYIAKAQGQLKSLDDIDKLVNDLSGPTGYLKLIPGASSKPSELENLSFASVEPILKIFNPTGQIAVTKMNRILDQYAVKKWDTKATAKGKTTALRSLLNQGLQRAQQRNALIEQYEGNPPPEKLREFDKDSENVLDVISDAQKEKINSFDELPDPATLKGRIMTNPETGERMKSNGTSWEPV
jgi:hypothetical protein